MLKIFIPCNVASSKNSKQWTGKFLVSSKTTQAYIKATAHHYMAWRSDFKWLVKGLPKPYKVGFYFIRDSKRKFDFVNVAQLPLDLMVKHGWIDDDNMDEIVPVFLGYHVDKEKAGLEITIQ
jgi:Holliday junction resolvase RusA-like endonuclease